MNSPISGVAWRRLSIPCLALAAFSLAGCLSSSSSSSDSVDAPTPTVMQGRFIDSAVQGLSYSTATRDGVTDAEGTFSYQEGEQVSFSVGGLVLGDAPGQDLLTPRELVEGAADTAHPAVINIARLLQTLDDDGNLANGILISEETSAAVEVFLADSGAADLDLADTAAFESAMAGEDGLLGYLNQQQVFAENAAEGERTLRSAAMAWQHLEDSLELAAGGAVDFDLRPVLFIHGGAGSASQFESQAQRFRANGYPRSYLAVYEYDTSTGVSLTDPQEAGVRNARINDIIDELLLVSGATQVNLMGHSMGTGVSMVYLGQPDNAARVAHYVSIDGGAPEAPPGGVPTMALWGQYVTQEIGGDAINVYPSEDDPVGHIEVATSADSFARMYRFFNNDQAPATLSIPDAEGEFVWLAGRVNLFPQNIGAEGTTLEIREIDPNTASRLADTPDHVQAIDASGAWGPVRLTKGASYEFALLREGSGNDQYFYREPYTQDSYFLRFNTSLPGAGVGSFLARSANHTNLSISRDMELWGDQQTNDNLTVNGTPVVTPITGALENRLSNLFLHDRNSDGVSTLPGPDPLFHALPFMSGLDLHIPAASPPSQPISIELESRRGGEVRRVTVPNWPSSQVRSIGVHFRDYVQE